MSRHVKAGTDCVACHGPSQGHVADERNNVKPDRLPRAAAISGLCATCHAAGCPKSGRKDACQDCHHVHALVNPAASPVVKDERLDRRQAARRQAATHVAAGERLVQQERWSDARREFAAALEADGGDSDAATGLRVCARRLNPVLPGFDAPGREWDAHTGLPRSVRVAGLGIPMLLVAGGEFEMGSERFPGSRPVHTVRVAPFYLGKYEVTQAEWVAVMGSNPSAYQPKNNADAGRLPVENVSWEDAQAFLAKLNQRISGGGFRLPTEAEWEFAARAGHATPEPAAEEPHPAGAGKPDALGFADLLGNVWEWCSSVYLPYPFDEGATASATGGLRVLRGGGFADGADLLDPAMRHAERPSRRMRWNGLRLARTVAEP